MEITRKERDGARAELRLWDATSIIVGIMIGVGIFETPYLVFNAVPGPLEAMGVWVVGGILALIGALCFAELASTYPHSGGEYVYLTRAYGPFSGFLFGWAQLAVIRPANIGALAYICAERAQAFVDVPIPVLALAAVAVLTVVNILGATMGAWTQNLLAAAKVIGLGCMVYWLLRSPWQIPEPTTLKLGSSWFAEAMVLVLWTYAGWNEAAYIAAEVKDGRRNLPLALILGTLAVMFIYLVVNGALLLALGFDGARALEPAKMIQGDFGKLVNVAVIVSSLGAINGMIFTTARISSAMGKDHRLYRVLGHWSSWGAPVLSLLVCGFVNLGYLAGSALYTHLAGEKALGQSKNLVEFWIVLTAALFWFFFLLTGLSLLILRARDPLAIRPFRVPLYPYLPIVFCAWCAYMVGAMIIDKPSESFFGFLVLLVGLPFYFLPQKRWTVPGKAWSKKTNAMANSP